MTALALTRLSSVADLFAPVDLDLVANLIRAHDDLQARVRRVHTTTQDGPAIAYFAAGAARSDSDLGRISLSSFQLAPALAALGADHWSKLISLAGLLEIMPEKRRREWLDQIERHECPPFTLDTIQATMAAQLGARADYFAEKVDGIFGALSRRHVTNKTAKFGPRLIIPRMIGKDGWPDYYSGHLHDLRGVCATLAGTETPNHQATHTLLHAAARSPGQWLMVDGGLLRIRVYTGVGTAHLEIHQDLIPKLNLVLAHHAARTLGETRVRGPAPKVAKPTTWALMSRPLPGAVRAALGDARLDWAGETLTWYGADRDRPLRAEVRRVIRSLGGVPGREPGTWSFGYPVRSVLDEVLASGCVPDTAAHQFYPTPGHLADRMVALAAVVVLDVLEPSAGHGAIASRLPVDQVTCVEVSALHVAILRAKGLRVHQADFLTWASTRPHWSRIVMNPPFGDGRWQAHLTRAVSLLALGGRVVAMLPASARLSTVPTDLGLAEVTWSEVLTGEFAGTSVSTVILTGVRDR